LLYLFIRHAVVKIHHARVTKSQIAVWRIAVCNSPAVIAERTNLYTYF
jgi:hypothetical protein